jgi:tetratricopeptide (TPR) repeat protein
LAIIDASKLEPRTRQKVRPFNSATGRRMRIIPGALALVALLAGHAAVAQTIPATPPPVIGGDANGPPWLNHLLNALKPSVDTSLPEGVRTAENRLSTQIDSGKAAQALTEIDQRLEANKQKNTSGVDVQLLFLKARALNALDRRPEAKDLYRQMTERFPELPEPWNNLAALQVADGQLDQAKLSLDMAVRTSPNYVVARENLGDLYMMLAARSYGAADKLAPTPTARSKRDGIKTLLEAPPPQPANRTSP